MVVHGFGEHSGRYGHVFAALGAAGWSCLGIDYRGWGRAEGRRGHIARFDEYLDDVQWGLDECRARSPHPPVLLGHSQGGLVSALFAIERATKLRGLVLSSPALRFAMPIPGYKRAIAALASVVWPTLAMRAGIDARLLTRDPAMLEALRADPLIVRRATVRWFTESGRAQQRAMAGAAQISVPLLFLVAGADRIVDAAATREFQRRCSTATVFHEYEGACHEVLNEVPAVRQRALADLTDWLGRLA